MTLPYAAMTGRRFFIRVRHPPQALIFFCAFSGPRNDRNCDTTQLLHIFCLRSVVKLFHSTFTSRNEFVPIFNFLNFYRIMVVIFHLPNLILDLYCEPTKKVGFPFPFPFMSGVPPFANGKWKSICGGGSKDDDDGSPSERGTKNEPLKASSSLPSLSRRRRIEAAKHETSFESRSLPRFSFAAGNARFKYLLSE